MPSAIRRGKMTQNRRGNMSQKKYIVELTEVEVKGGGNHQNGEAFRKENNTIGLWTRLKQRKIGIKRKGIMRVSTKKIIIPKPIMPIIFTETEFQKFRFELHSQFKNLADSAMDLLDALCSKGLSN